MPSQAKFIIKLYINHNTLFVKHGTYQKSESSRAAPLSKLGNMFINNSIFNIKCHNYLQNGRCPFIFTTLLEHPTTLTLSTKVFLQLILTSLFRSYLFIKSFLQSLLTFSSSIPQHFFTSIFLRTGILKIHIKNIFPTSVI